MTHLTPPVLYVFLIARTEVNWLFLQTSDPENDEPSDEVENEEDTAQPISKLSQLAARRSRRDSDEWEEMKNLDDNWAEIDEIPSDARYLAC